MYTTRLFCFGHSEINAFYVYLAIFISNKIALQRRTACNAGPPATLDRLQHLTAFLIQNGRRGPERC